MAHASPGRAILAPMETPFTLPFATFWSWLMSHPNCILRAGTPEAVLYDDEDLHWHFAAEGEHTLLVQVLRGKTLLGELLLEPSQVSYVQLVPPERPDEHTFELMSDVETEPFTAYFFVLTHGWEEETLHSPGRVH
jgi:hypothetical protein